MKATYSSGQIQRKKIESVDWNVPSIRLEEFVPTLFPFLASLTFLISFTAFSYLHCLWREVFPYPCPLSLSP